MSIKAGIYWEENWQLEEYFEVLKRELRSESKFE